MSPWRCDRSSHARVCSADPSTLAMSVSNPDTNENLSPDDPFLVCRLLLEGRVRLLWGNLDSIGGQAMTVKYRVYGALIASVLLLGPMTAAAQERAPHRGSTAVGFDVGMLVPRDDRLDTA